MNKQELIDYCNAIKENKNQIINCIDVNRIIKRIEQLDEPQKVPVPQFVADWYENNKDSFDYNLWEYLTDWEEQEPSDFKNWINNKNNTFQILVNMHQFGYTVEKEKRYLVKVKGICGNNETLNRKKHSNEWLFSDRKENSLYDTHHTRKELEEAGFGEVFNSQLFEVEEVE